jgi:Xaa-Pro aminopeptidase
VLAQGHYTEVSGSKAAPWLVQALRGRKSARERARIQAACDITTDIYDRLSSRLHAGLTEKQVAAMTLEEMDRWPSAGREAPAATPAPPTG